MSDELNRFMAEGLERYPAAFAAVDRFDQEIRKVLTEVLLGSESWGAFRRTGEPSTNSGGRPGKGCWIYALQQGTLRNNNLGLEIGLWWDPPNGPTGTMLLAYTNPSVSRGRLESLRAAQPEDPVRVQTLDGKARLVVEVPPGTEIAGRLEHLLVEMTSFLSTLSEPL